MCFPGEAMFAFKTSSFLEIESGIVCLFDTLYVTRHDILCPNAVKRDVGKTRCKSDVIYATALYCAFCTSPSVIC